jgi:hypothetical protein
MPEQQKESKVTPPYLSALTVENILTSLVEKGVPQQLDRSVLSNVAGGVQRQLLSAFQYLGLTDNADKPTAIFKEYEKADPEQRKAVLGRILTARYPKQVQLLSDGTLQQLKDSFTTFQIEPSVRGKCVSFFLKMAKRAELKISSHIGKGIRSTGPRRNSKPKAKPPVDSQPKNAKKDHDEISPPPGMIMTPIPLGPGKTWTIYVPAKPDAGDAERFIQVAKIVLGVGEKTQKR